MKYSNLVLMIFFLLFYKIGLTQIENKECYSRWIKGLRNSISSQIKDVKEKLDTVNFQDMYLFGFTISKKNEIENIISTKNVPHKVFEIFHFALDSMLIDMKAGGCDSILLYGKNYMIPIFLDYKMFKNSSNDKKISSKELNYLNSIFQPPSDKKPNQNPAIPKDCIFFPFLNCRVTPYGTLFDTF